MVNNQRIMVPCGQCIACRLNYARDWSFRIMQESAKYPFNIFLTLTYNDEHLADNPSRTLIKSDVQLFLKRLRKALHPRKIRFFASGEYGEKYKRPHYHLIMFNVSQADQPIIEKCWRKGYVYIGSVTFDSAAYVAKYAVKKLNGKKKVFYEENHIIPEFALMSRRPGIGQNFLEEHEDYMKDHNFVIRKGQKMSIPRFYEDKMYPTGSDERKAHQEEKNKLRLSRLGMTETQEYLFNRSVAHYEQLQQRDVNNKRRTTFKKGVFDVEED